MDFDPEYVYRIIELGHWGLDSPLDGWYEPFKRRRFEDLKLPVKAKMDVSRAHLKSINEREIRVRCTIYFAMRTEKFVLTAVD